jgi:hypothetical protein
MKLIRTGKLVRCFVLTALTAATASCGDVVTAGDAPVMLVVNSISLNEDNTFGSDLLTNGSVSNDVGSVTLEVIMKDITTITSPSTNNAVTIRRYRVEYIRADGHNVPGVDVPYAFDGATTVTIPAGNTATFSVELVRHTAKREPPLLNLLTTGGLISTIGRVTFYGADQVGNDVSAVATLQINFADFADAQ